MMRPNWILIGAILGATFVIHAAFGAHWLEERVSTEQLEWWETGAFHHGVHALAIMGFGLMRLRREASDLPGWLLLAGVLIFSTTLYVMALGGPRWLGAVTPIGGSLLVLGWLGFAWTSRREEG
ncbi:MAG: DUF423 domain-containing protein [Planctomycetes bacterium]|nr:DUF423 domain-containing protein [Planctomycetota bacterium]